MSYKQIKWIILLLPTLTVACWEELRHTPFLLTYISMELGNWLTPVIVFVVTMVVAKNLFHLLEKIQKQLEEERSLKLILQEREMIARQLHDGIAQSLFLLSVKINQVESNEAQLKDNEDYQKIQKTVQHIHQDVRQAILHLRNPSSQAPLPWTDSVQEWVEKFQKESGLTIDFSWNLPEGFLSIKEKLELFSCLKEAAINVQKHAEASQVRIEAQYEGKKWSCVVEDDGIGITSEQLEHSEGYGLHIMKDRVKEMGWDLKIERSDGKTRVTIQGSISEQNKTNEPTMKS
ncbi:sensor histidine kinase [Caldalkalibacillus mannanilyticus]|uniref:sensor histidine kinase n=1 Tax=Caldalkalibacillus mannanilyticus TaxID=1418 RepID=UPI0004690D7D|nr:ATP-binding protein [Caldalkalibacillus mannanilyticus]